MMVMALTLMDALMQELSMPITIAQRELSGQLTCVQRYAEMASTTSQVEALDVTMETEYLAMDAMLLAMLSKVTLALMLVLELAPVLAHAEAALI
jgi:hypothetical protein